METLSRITETRLIPLLRPHKPDQTLPLLAALCSGGIFAAEFSMEIPFTPDAIKNGSRLFPDLVLGAGDIICVEDARTAIRSGARYVTSPGHSKAIADLCREHETLYLPQCTSPSELLTAKSDGLPAAGLFAPHLWGSEALVAELTAAFPGLSAIVCRIPYTDAWRLLSLPGIAACTLTGLPCDSPEELAAACRKLTVQLAD
ncbi:MAG: hypothetical protein IJX47_07320 [Clostridia bacterium]|nr:hypothetical protein [Clostridia bacterium]